MTIERFHPVFIVGIIVLLFTAYQLVRRYYYGRHRRNIRKSHELLEMFGTWTGQYLDQRILLYLRKINPYVFEELVLTALERIGGNIKRSKKYSGDGGIDGRFTYNNRMYIVQSKRYKQNINTAHVKQFANIATTYEGGIFVHTGKTPQSARSACANNIVIISGKRLVALMTMQITIDNIFPR